MQLFRNLTALLSLIELSPIFQQFTQVVKDICVATASEQEILTFIYTSIGNPNSATPIYTHLDVPLILHTLRTQHPTSAVISIDIRTPIERYSQQFNRNVLSIVQLTQNGPRDEQLLQTLWQRLRRNRQSRIILLLDDTASEAYVAMILKFCAEERAINVIALQPNLAMGESSYWTLQIFPIQKTVKRTFQPYYRDVFPKHLKNMHGHPLRIMDNAWYPQFYNYTPKKGPVRLSGYGGRALSEYAHLHNATIKFPFTLPTKSAFTNETSDALLSKAADIGLLFPLELSDSKLGSTSVVRRVDWCLMVPVENPMPAYTFYYSIMDKWVFILFCVSVVLISLIWARISHKQSQQQQPIMENFVNVSVLQGLLGIPFWTKKSISTIHKVMCVIISLAGVIIGTAYSTYLQSFSVNAPKEPYARTIDDLLKRGIKISVGNRSQYWITHFTNLDKYLENFTYFSNYTELLLLRDTLDTGYAFPVSDMWPLYDEQQKYFSRPLFRLSDICFGKETRLVLPLQKDSIYRESLDQFLLKLQETGLIIHWLRQSFIELLDMDVISLEDRNKQPIFVPLKLEDLRVVLMGMGVLISLSILCFVLEIFWEKIGKLLNSMKKGMGNIIKISK